MSLGFGSDNEVEEVSKELPHKVMDTLKWQPWNSLVVGMKVQSILTKTKGFISALHNQWEIVEINWDNGNQTKANKSSLSKVVML